MRRNRRRTKATCGVSKSFGTSTVTTHHSVGLTGLASGTTYHYRVKSVDADGNEAVSSDQTLTTAPAHTTGQLEIHFINAGNGDAILVQHVTDQGTNSALIDGGDGSSDIVSCLNNYVDGALATVVATHSHKDHIAGLIPVLDEFEVEQLWYNGNSVRTETNNNFMSAVQAAEAEVRMARRGDQIPLGDLSFAVLNPTDAHSTVNNNSVVLKLDYGQVHFLFQGDAEWEAEAMMLDAGLVTPVDVLKLGHHGSRTASSWAFLVHTRPKIAVCTAGIGNIYGHPHAETISALQAVGAKTYVTGFDGTISVTTDGGTCTVATTSPGMIVRPSGTSDSVSLLISHITASRVTSSAATILWTTDVPATSQVEYGLTTSYGSITRLDSCLLTSHCVSLSNTDTRVAYHFTV